MRHIFTGTTDQYKMRHRHIMMGDRAVYLKKTILLDAFKMSLSHYLQRTLPVSHPYPNRPYPVSCRVSIQKRVISAVLISTTISHRLSSPFYMTRIASKCQISHQRSVIEYRMWIYPGYLVRIRL